MSEKTIPILFKNKEDCCGCCACADICPANAITMIYDEYGFEYPNINSEKCIMCHKCIKVCTFK
jgi:formate hydrogenlyase subunit 6/NADH:ubiquinone oxidoreductase subunit I